MSEIDKKQAGVSDNDCELFVVEKSDEDTLEALRRARYPITLVKLHEIEDNIAFHESIELEGKQTI